MENKTKSAEVEERVLAVAEHALLSKKTIRQLAATFAVSKSTIHKDLLQRLPKINKNLADLVYKEVIIYNKEQGVIRGGRATANLWRIKANQNRQV